MKKCLLLVLVLVVIFGLIPRNATAQEGIGALNIQLGIPQGPFRDQLETVGGGVGGMVGYLFPGAPVLIGVDLGVMTFGNDTRTVPLSSTIPDVRVEVENSYNMFHGHFLLRITGRDRNFRPFVDMLAGMNYLYTQTTVRSRGSQEDIFTDTNFDDFTYSYGIGAGVQVLLFREKKNRIYLNAQSRYLIGGEAEYIRPGTVDTSNGEFTYEVGNSRTDMLYIQVGVAVSF